MFIQCFDNELKNKLISNGYKLLNECDSWAIFAIDNNNQKLDFSSIDNKKYIMTNRLSF